MNRHLREEEICRWLAGERSPAAEEHIGSCAECRVEMARQQEVLTGFQGAVRERSLRGLARLGHVSAQQPQTGVRSGLGRAPSWGLAGLVAAGLAAVAWLPLHSTKAVPTDSHTSDDAALLKRIGADMSRTVPGPMEPLTKLMEWQPDTGGR